MMMIRTPEGWRGIEVEILPPIHTSKYNQLAQRAVPTAQEYTLGSIEVVLSYSQYMYQGWISEWIYVTQEAMQPFPMLYMHPCCTSSHLAGKGAIATEFI